MADVIPLEGVEYWLNFIMNPLKFIEGLGGGGASENMMLMAIAIGGVMIVIFLCLREIWRNKNSSV